MKTLIFSLIIIAAINCNAQLGYDKSDLEHKYGKAKTASSSGDIDEMSFESNGLLIQATLKKTNSFDKRTVSFRISKVIKIDAAPGISSHFSESDVKVILDKYSDGKKYSQKDGYMGERQFTREDDKLLIKATISPNVITICDESFVIKVAQKADFNKL